MQGRTRIGDGDDVGWFFLLFFVGCGRLSEQSKETNANLINHDESLNKICVYGRTSSAQTVALLDIGKRSNWLPWPVDLPERLAGGLDAHRPAVERWWSQRAPRYLHPTRQEPGWNIEPWNLEMWPSKTFMAALCRRLLISDVLTSCRIPCSICKNCTKPKQII